MYGPYKITAVDFTNKTITLDETTDTNGADGASTSDIDDITSTTGLALHFLWNSSF